MYLDRSFIKDNDLSVMIPMNTSKEILVGKYNDVTDYMDDLHSAEVRITSSENDCVLQLDWNILEDKSDYYYHIRNNVYIPKLKYKSNPFCSMSGTLEEKFMNWEKSLEDAYVDLFPYKALTYMKPEESEVDLSKVKQKFLDVKTIYERNGMIYANISHWGGDDIPWKFMGSLDSQGLLHSTCTFVLPVDYYNSTGTHNFLDWSIKLFSGTFDHGKLNGAVLIVTWDAANIFAMFKDGELHGPAFGFGRIPVFDIATVSFHFENDFLLLRM